MGCSKVPQLLFFIQFSWSYIICKSMLLPTHIQMLHVYLFASVTLLCFFLLIPSVYLDEVDQYRPGGEAKVNWRKQRKSCSSCVFTASYTKKIILFSIGSDALFVFFNVKQVIYSSIPNKLLNLNLFPESHTLVIGGDGTECCCALVSDGKI